MLEQFRFSDILNIISTGVLLQLLILGFVYFTYPEDVLKFINFIATKEISVLATAIAIIIAIPISRIISAFVESLMYPVDTKGATNFFKKLTLWLLIIYKMVFFFLAKKSGTKSSSVLCDKIKSPDKLFKLFQGNIKEVFGLEEVDKLTEEDCRELFYSIRSFVIKNNTTPNLYFLQYNTIYNYHTRLAIIFNICTVLSLYNYFKNSILNGLFWDKNLLSLTVFYVLTIYFANTLSQYGKRQVDLLVNDFNATYADIKIKK